MSHGYMDQLPSEALSRYKKKLAICCLDDCPYRLPANVWKNDPTEWPDVHYGDIYTYLIDTPGIHTKEAMKNYRGLESYELLLSGWVLAVEHMKPDGSDITIFRTDVVPSFRLNDDPHHPWVAVRNTGTVITAHCDCKAGLGESCSHIGGLLYKIESCVKNGIRKNPACTDTLCAWNSCDVQGVQPAPVSKIQFYSEAAKRKVNVSSRRRAKPTPLSYEEQQNFLKTLAEITAGDPNPPVGLSIFKATAHLFYPKEKLPPVVKLPPSLRTFYGKEDCRLVLTPEQIDYVKTATVKQSDSLDWYEQRAGRITASSAHDVLKTDMEKPSASLIKRVCSDAPSKLNVEAVVWGREKEAVAREAYTHGMLRHGHKNIRVNSSGLSISSEKQFLAASPDGIITCDCHGMGVLEVKCPFSHREHSVKEMLMDPSCPLGTGGLKVNHRYYTQVQLQIYATGASFCDFILWIPAGVVSTRVLRDEGFLKDSLPKLEAFWERHIQPELKTREYENRTSKIVQPSESHCSCGHADSEPMIGCDDNDCPNQWYHFACVGIKRAPRKARWYCDLCRPRNMGKPAKKVKRK